MKKIITYFSITAFVIIITGCQKDLYEDTIAQEQRKITKEKISINEALKIIPALEMYNSGYSYLFDGSQSNKYLDLDLKNILKVTDYYGKETFSINIKKTFEEYQNKYFENLHIWEKNGEFESLIFKYDALDDDKKFDISTFTGMVDVFKLDGSHIAVIEYENGRHVHLKWIVSYPCWEILIYSNGNYVINSWCGGAGTSTGEGSSGHGGTSTGEGGNGSSGTGNNGNNTNTQTPDDYSYEHSHVIGINAPLTSFQMANEIYAWLGVNDISLRTWLRANLVFSSEIFGYIFDDMGNVLPGLDVTDQAFFIEAIDAIRNGGEVDFPNNIIYAFNMPCQKQIVKDIIDNCSPFTNLIYQTFNTDDRANIKFKTGVNEEGAPAVTQVSYSGGSEKPLITIQFDTAYLNTATNLSIVGVTLHELVHAYLMTLYIKGKLLAANPNYETLLSAYVVFYANQSQATFDPLDEAMHNAMNDFINPMANSIYNYALSENIAGANPDFCLKLAWGGMHGYNLFTQSLTLEQQQEYEEVTATEQDNLTGAKGTPCN